MVHKPSESASGPKAEEAGPGKKGDDLTPGKNTMTESLNDEKLSNIMCFTPPPEVSSNTAGKTGVLARSAPAASVPDPVGDRILATALGLGKNDMDRATEAHTAIAAAGGGLGLLRATYDTNMPLRDLHREFEKYRHDAMDLDTVAIFALAELLCSPVDESKEAGADAGTASKSEMDAE